MAKKNFTMKEVLKGNYPQLILVFAAFILMILMGSFFVGFILRNRLRAGAEEALYTAEANVKAGLAEAEVTLLNSYYIVRNMVDEGAPQEEILAYLTDTTGWMRQRAGGLLGFFGISGYIRGEFLDSIGFNLGGDYVPQRQPWYQAAVRSGNTVAYTAPYADWRTGELIVSAVRNIDNAQGEIYGILSVDINISWLQEYISSLRLAPGGYGMLVSQNMTLITHPDKERLGLQLQELASVGSSGGAYSEISRILRTGGDVYAGRIVDTDGTPVIVFFRRVFNGWYVGLVTPYQRFYRDLYFTIAALSVLGLILAFFLSLTLLRLSAAKIRSDEESKSKSSFLARMSHEIRTPMNAIIGMSELTMRSLREGQIVQAGDYAGNIRQAGDNLLSIINDILDFSKIESGKIEIANTNYLFSSLLNDVISIIRMRLNEKPVLFVTRIDGSLPSAFKGDEVRIRQIMLNILGNAIKYTREGYISLVVKNDNAALPAKGDTILLTFEVSDTGIGIKPEDTGKLFGDFAQFDMQYNRGVEGTGLGLAISRNFCRLMGGDITVESTYGEGSVFRVALPQEVADAVPFAEVEHPETKSVLVFDERRVYAESIAYTVDNLGVGCAMVSNREDFLDRLSNNTWQYVFTSSSLFDEVREILRTAAPYITLVLLTEYGEAARPNIHVLAMPVQPISVANILNGKAGDKGYHEIEKPGIRFIAPDAWVLIVDDITTNLDVAEGLMAPYKMKIDCCTSGLEAVHLAEKNPYDIIFMDHMMPGMDGIEATAAIRASEESGRKDGTPEAPKRAIVALTANAVSGMREMYLQKGFNEFLSKPIEIAKLDETLGRWIPKEKQQKVERGEEGGGRTPFSSLVTTPHPPLTIPGVDTAKGLAMTGGTEARYRKVLTSFYKDAGERLPLLKTFLDGDSPPNHENPERDFHAFSIQVHALKTAAATIGAALLSKEAADLEAMSLAVAKDIGKAEDMTAIRKSLPPFLEHLKKTAEEIQKAVEKNSGEKEGGEKGGENPSLYREIFLSLKEALERKDLETADRLLTDLEGNPLDTKTREAVEAVSDHVLITEFDAAIDVIDALLAAGASGE